MGSMPRTTPWTVRQLRRGASLRLAELASGMPWYRCTEVLSIPNKAARGTISLLGRELGSARLWPEFEARVAAIARQISEENNPTDYSSRLHALAGWRLPLDDWMVLCDLPLIGRLRAKEDAAPGTVFVWSESTSAEYLHSPLIQESIRSRESTVPRGRPRNSSPLIARQAADEGSENDSRCTQPNLRTLVTLARACELSL